MRRLVDLLASELKKQTPTCLDLTAKIYHIFDPTSRLHKNAFQKVDPSLPSAATSSVETNKSTNGAQDPSIFNESEREWRLALDKDKTIDVFKRDVKRKAQMWTKGTIVAVTGVESDMSKKMLTISFYQDVSVVEVSYPASS